MSDPTSTSAGTSTGGNTGTAVGLDQVLAAVAALAASVQTVVSQSGATQAMQTQIADGLKSLSENVNKIAQSTDSDSGYLIRSSIDPADNQARVMAKRDEIETVNLKMLVDMAEHNKAQDQLYLSHMADILGRQRDHFSALPPIAPRAASGPGTTAS